MITLLVDILYISRCDMNNSAKLSCGLVFFLIIITLSCSEEERKSPLIHDSANGHSQQSDKRFLYDEIAEIMGVTSEKIEEFYDQSSELDKRRFLLSLCFQTIIPDDDSISVDKHPNIFFELQEKFSELSNDSVITIEELVKVSSR